jgi:serine/threonine protein kinase
MGTVGYMAPEQVRGEAVDHRADIFALGAILYEMLAGKRAFEKSTSAETMTSILNDDPSAISQIVKTAPPGLQRVVHRCLEKNPEQLLLVVNQCDRHWLSVRIRASRPQGQRFPVRRNREPAMSMIFSVCLFCIIGKRIGVYLLERDAVIRRSLA